MSTIIFQDVHGQTDLVSNFDYSNPEADFIIKSYHNNLIDRYGFFDYRDNEGYIFDVLIIVYVDGNVFKTDYYERHTGQPWYDGIPYEFEFSHPLNEEIRRLSSFRDVHEVERNIYTFLENVFIQNLRNKIILWEFRPKFAYWLDSARHSIVKREAHPSKVQTLLDMGYEIEEALLKIASTTDNMLSW